MSIDCALASWPAAFFSALFLLGSSTIASGQVLGTAQITLTGVSVDINTRPDLPGISYTMTAVKGISTGVQTVVNAGSGSGGSFAFTPGSLVKASLAGPGFGQQIITVAAPPNGTMPLPLFQAAGDYTLYDIRLEDPQGNVLLRRDSTLPPIQIKVIDQILVTQVTATPLTLDEIQQLGIQIDQSNFQVLNFTVALTFGSNKVTVKLPFALPLDFSAVVSDPGTAALAQTRAATLAPLGIPNLTLVGFRMSQPPDTDDKGLMLPPINGVIIIPGNIGFLHQFFSMYLQTSNLAPDGSGLVVNNAAATINLPPGADNILDTGDDPLRLAKTASGATSTVSLVDSSGGASILPQSTNTGQFLVEGLKTGTFPVNFNITGDLTVPGLGHTVPLVGNAVGVVKVENPTFNIVLAHPDVVRAGEAYSIYATVTNRSSIPANLFSLSLKGRSLSGAHLATGETGARTLATLAGGQSQAFRFNLVAETTGHVTGTVFQADDGITGSFILTTGVGDTGIPLSPDTLVLPKQTSYLPTNPDFIFAVTRLLGQEYSAATAPAGSLPAGTLPISSSYVLNRMIRLGQEGFHVAFGESNTQMVEDIAMDFGGNDLQRAATLYASDNPATVTQASTDIQAFDIIRRTTDAGHSLAQVMGQLLATGTNGTSIAQLQGDWAQRVTSLPAHLSLGVNSRGPPLVATVTDAGGHITGQSTSSSDLTRDIPYFEFYDLSSATAPGQSLIVGSVVQNSGYTFSLIAPAATSADVSLVLPTNSGLTEVLYSNVTLAAGERARLVWTGPAATSYTLALDANGDGSFSQQLAPTSVTPVPVKGPVVSGVMQWGHGQFPVVFYNGRNYEGDPLGRVVGVLYDREVNVDPSSAIFSADHNGTIDTQLQPDRRLVFVQLTNPVGPFVPRTLTSHGVTDTAGHAAGDDTHAIRTDPNIGIGATLLGRALRADGTPLPFSTVQYIQLVTFCGTDCVTIPVTVTSLTTDSTGHFALDFVLRDDNGDYQLQAIDPDTGDLGSVSSQVQFNGQALNHTLIVRGSAALQGTVYDTNGAPLTYQLQNGQLPGQPTDVVVLATNTNSGEVRSSWVDETGHYAFPRRFVDPAGNSSEALPVTVGDVVLQVVRPSDQAAAVVTVNVPNSGAAVSQDLFLRPSQQFGSLSGRVLEADGQTPAAGVKLQVVDTLIAGIVAVGLTETSTGVVAVGTTDASGLFSFSNLPVGSIQIVAQRASTGEQTTSVVNLSAGAPLNVDVVLPGLGGTVNGVVRDAFGNAVPFAKVAAGDYLVNADQNGDFSISHLPRGTLTVYGQGSASPALATQKIQTNSPSDVQTITLTLQPTGTIQGTVYEVDRATPVPAQKIQLWVQDQAGKSISGGAKIAETLTDANGNFAFINYPLYDYSLRVIKEDLSDGGAVLSSIRFAGDLRNVNVYMRGPAGKVTGRVIQTNGTPAIADLIWTHKHWVIKTTADGLPPNPYLDFVNSLISQGGDLGASVQNALGDAFSYLNEQYFVLEDDLQLGSSNILGPNGEVTGRFQLQGGAPGSFEIQALSSFLSPASKKGIMPSSADPAGRNIDVGDIVLTPATASVEGTVYLPDGKTPVGANVRVSALTTGPEGVLPPISVVTNPQGHFSFPLIPNGGVTLTADTGEPDPGIKAQSAVQMRTDAFADANGNRILNVRLHGVAQGSTLLGGTVSLDVRLKNAAEVDVQVVQDDGKTPVPQAVIDLTTEQDWLLDATEKAGHTKQIADANGTIQFFPINEGTFTLTANKVGVPIPGILKGAVPQGPGNGRTLNAVVQMGAATSASGEVTVTRFYGSVAGQVLDADGKPVTFPVRITVNSGSISVSTATDSSGNYLARYVPAGPFTVTAFEPYTGRSGLGAGTIATSGATVTIPLTLAGLGTVSGQVFDGAGAPVANADVTLTTNAAVQQKIATRSDPNGSFSFPGVPVGDYALSARDFTTGLAGSAQGTLASANGISTTDVYLQAAANIQGTVYLPGTLLNSSGQPVDSTGKVLTAAPVVANATVVISLATDSSRKSERTVATDANGHFDAGGNLPLGQHVVIATAQSLPEGAKANTTLSYGGQISQVPLVLAGIGRVEGVVLDSTGTTPVNAAQVALSSLSPFSGGDLNRITGPDGIFVFDTVPLGTFALSARTTLNAVELGTSLQDALTTNGQDLQFRDGGSDPTRRSLRLQPSAGVQGLIVNADGVTPAVGAVVELRGVKSNTHVAHPTGATGSFLFQGLPLDQYGIQVTGTGGSGSATRAATLSTNAQVLDAGTIVLDNQAPQVVSTVPAASTTDQRVAAIVIGMSSPLAAATVSDSTVLVSVGGSPVAGTVSLSTDGRTITFTPAARLPDLQRVTVDLKGPVLDFEGQVLQPGISDTNGLGLKGTVEFYFTTADQTPPVIVSFTPADGSTDVALDSVVRIQFNKPIDPGSIRGLTLAAGGTTVAGQLSNGPQQGGTVIVFAPAAPLVPNTTYTATLQGPVRDLSGNAMAQAAITAKWVSLNTAPPAVASVTTPSGGSLIQGGSGTFAASVSSTTAIDHVEFYVNGQLAATVSHAPYTFTLPLSAQLGGNIVISAVAVDVSGNRSSLASSSFTIAPPQAPQVSLSLTSGSIALQSATATVTVNGTDAVGLQSLSFAAGGGSIARATQTVSGTSASATFQFQVPANIAAGTQIPIQASAVNAAGLVTLSSTAQLTVADANPPVVILGSPSPGTKLVPGTTVPVVVSADDVSLIKRIELTASGAVQATFGQDVTPATTPAAATFTLAIPSSAQPNGVVTLTARAIDGAGTPATQTYTFHVAVTQGPVITLASTVNGPTTIGAGQTAHLRVTASSAAGLNSITLFPDGTPPIIRSLTGPTQDVEFFDVVVPATLPIGATFGFSAAATDAQGNTTSATRLVYTIANTTPPTVSILAPASGAKIPSAHPLTVSVSASGTVGLTSVSYTASGAISDSQSVTLTGAPQATAQQFTVNIPASATAGSVINLQATATDSSGLIGTTSETVTVTDGVPPAVTSVFPADQSTAVSRDTAIVFRFTKPLNAQSLSSSAVILTAAGSSQPIAGTLTLSSDQLSATFKPTALLTASATYALTVNGVADLVGNIMATPFTSGFTTGTQTDSVRPTIVRTSIASGATGIPINAHVTVEFSKRMNPATLTPQSITLRNNLTGLTIPATVQVDATGTRATLMPSAMLEVSRNYSLVISEAVTADLAGNTVGFGSTTVVSFTTSAFSDTTAPTVQQFVPALGALNVPTNAKLAVIFSKSIDAASADAAITLTQNGNGVPLAIALSGGNVQASLSTGANLLPNTLYQIGVSTALVDLAGNALAAPATSSFQTGAGPDTSALAVVGVSPAQSASNIPLNTVMSVTFNKRLSPVSVDATTVQLYDLTLGVYLTGTVSLSADGQSLSFTPAALLSPSRGYRLYVSVQDLAGNSFSSSYSFTTAQNSQTQPDPVTAQNLANGLSNVPVNAPVILRFGAPLSTQCVKSGAVQVTAGGAAVAGAVALSSDGLTLTFTPSANLAASTTYTVQLSGLCDLAGNPSAAFNSTFTTSASATADKTAPTLVSLTPASGASNVPVTTTVVATLSKPIDPTSVSASTLSLQAPDGTQIAGTYSLNGSVLTLTPTAALPPATRFTVYLSYLASLRDLAGNALNPSATSFTTATGTDSTAPQVVAVSPANQAQGISITNPITLSFSKPLSAASVNTASFAVYSNGQRLSPSILRSADGQTVTLTGTWPQDSTLQVTVTSQAQDLSGNAATGFLSSFTTEQIDQVHTFIASQRPGNGASSVGRGVSLVLFASEALNAATLANAVQVAVNGTLVTGNLSLVDSGRTIVFTPSQPWPFGALVEVNVTSAALDSDGLALTPYSASFHIATDPSAAAPQVMATSFGTALNAVFEWQFNVPLDLATVNATTVTLVPGGCFSNTSPVSSTISVLNGGLTIRLVPTQPLQPSSTYGVCVAGTNTSPNAAIRALNGQPLLSSYPATISIGTTADTQIPTLRALSPQDGLTAVPTNARVGVVFSEPINPLSVSTATVSLTAQGATNPVAADISFFDSNRRLFLTPQSPLANNTLYTLTVSGVEDLSGNRVSAQTNHFTTGAQPETVGPTILQTTPVQGAQSVPLNPVLSIELDSPVDAASALDQGVLYDPTLNQYLQTTASVSSGGRVVTYLPGISLAVNRNYRAYFGYNFNVTDLAGNPITGATQITFTTGTQASTAALQVTRVTPADGLTNVPTNAPIIIEFSAPLKADTAHNISLLLNGQAVAVNTFLSNGNRTLTLHPQQLLASTSSYSISVTNVLDVAGNPLGASSTTSFTTASSPILAAPTLVSSIPSANATAVPTNVVVQLTFSNRLSPASITATNVTLYSYAQGTYVSGNVSLSADGQLISWVPNQPLGGNQQFQLGYTIQDLAGNTVSGTLNFTTGP